VENSKKTLEAAYWESEDLFAIGIQVRTLAGTVHSKSEELVQLDTGYDGELLLPYQLYEDLGLAQWEYPEEYWSVGKTVSGEIINLILARGQVVIPRWGTASEVLIDTFDGNEEFLLGRRFIRKYKILLDGPGKRVCLMK
jgi:predicted aspartyl protease